MPFQIRAQLSEREAFSRVMTSPPVSLRCVEMEQFYAMRPIMEEIANDAVMRPLEAGEKTQWEPYVQVTFEKYVPDSCCRREQFDYTVSGAASLAELEDFEDEIATGAKSMKIGFM